jgi:serine/threonine-protein kinase
VLGPLGAGGMGEVYRARDAKLGRDIALKVLPDAFARDPERLSRFEREAHILASLNHPNIAAIYGIEESNGASALVLELVEGETLAKRIARGLLRLEDGLAIAVQVAEALEAAHEKGVIHRDLKPANISLTTGGVVKVLDFGLAKAAIDGRDDAASADLTIAATREGTLLGTVAYMSPEQSRGEPIDTRGDIWAFGCVVFEILTSHAAFARATVSETLAAILDREPEWSLLPQATPDAVRMLVTRCLTKNPRNRLQSIGDARILLQEAIDRPATAVRAPPVVERRWKRALLWAVVPLAVATGWLAKPTAPSAPRPLLQFEVTLPAGFALVHGSRHGAEVSPDGRRIAFVAAAADGVTRIFVRSLDQEDERPIPGTEGARNVFFSPDGAWLGFHQGQQIKKVSLAGGAPVVIVDNLHLDRGPQWGPPGITWGANGTIVLADALGSRLSVVRDTGGPLEAFTELDPAAHEASHRLPHFLPDASGVLFTVVRPAAFAPDWGKAQIWVKSTRAGERKLLIENAADARYAGQGTIVFAREGRLFAIRFDPASLSVRGLPVLVLDAVNQSIYGLNAVAWTGAAQFSLADAGALFYAPGSVDPGVVSSLTWVDRQGRTTPVAGLERRFRYTPRIHPDGVRIASSDLSANKHIWIFNTLQGTEDRATFTSQNAFPIWAPDGSRFAFRSDRNGALQIYVSEGMDTRNAKPLTSGPLDVPSSWTPDGKELIFTRGASTLGGNSDIYAVSIDDPAIPRPILTTPAEEQFPELSPDGKWLAYVSDESGRPELYVQPYREPGNHRVTITRGGAQEPAWSKNTNELFYRIDNQQLMTVPFTVSGGSFVPGVPQPLFRSPLPLLGTGTTVRATYDVAPDGRLLLNNADPQSIENRNQRINPSRLRFVLNWVDSLQPLLSAAERGHR